MVSEHEGQRTEAQAEVDKLAVEADLVGQQLADAQAESEELRMALGELDIKLQDLAEQAPEYDREALAVQLTEAQRAEAQLSEDRTRI
ncbi:MAG: hypothetical protein VX068_05990, partial [Candidatus Thermoplasmatota archaeon]|nr:hypothetical protein [Candidatus Thermoplasmatota archaeon]